MHMRKFPASHFFSTIKTLAIKKNSYGYVDNKLCATHSICAVHNI